MRIAWLPAEGFDHPLFATVPETCAMSCVIGFAAPVQAEGVEALQAIVDGWSKSTDWRAAGGEPGFAIEFDGAFLSVGLLGVPGAARPLHALVARLGEAIGPVREVALGLSEVDQDGHPGAFVEDTRLAPCAEGYRELLDANERICLDTREESGEAEAEIDAYRSDLLMQAYWRSSFDAAQPFPPRTDPRGMFSVVKYDDGSLVTERRCLLPYLPGVRIGYGLVEVEDRPVEQRHHEASRVVQACLERSFPEGTRPPVFNKQADADGPLDPIRAHDRPGFAFALRREDMLVRYPGTFRYREYELLAGLAAAVAEFGLAPVIHWDRASVYIVNLWEASVRPCSSGA